jgi:hypothetical protein
MRSHDFRSSSSRERSRSTYDVSWFIDEQTTPPTRRRATLDRKFRHPISDPEKRPSAPRGLP